LWNNATVHKCVKVIKKDSSKFVLFDNFISSQMRPCVSFLTERQSYDKLTYDLRDKIMSVFNILKNKELNGTTSMFCA